jgi:hypothetical protein
MRASKKHKKMLKDKIEEENRDKTKLSSKVFFQKLQDNMNKYQDKEDDDNKE